jgi:hypothetical protein
MIAMDGRPRLLALAQGLFDLLWQQFLDTTVYQIVDVRDFGSGTHFDFSSHI